MCRGWVVPPRGGFATAGGSGCRRRKASLAAKDEIGRSAARHTMNPTCGCGVEDDAVPPLLALRHQLLYLRWMDK